MTQKENGTNKPTSAPELPPELAKQFGLHHELGGVSAAKTADVNNRVVEGPKTDAAVDDILAKESDALLAVQDASQHEPIVRKRGFCRTVRHFFVSWWRNKWIRYATILVVMAGITAVAVIPTMRYAILNGAGVRSSASVVVLDNTTQLPLTPTGRSTKALVSGCRSPWEHSATTSVPASDSEGM
ncbi:MAG: hypothetical protein AAB834_06130, partial [Patescibacteria group bacterium]